MVSYFLTPKGNVINAVVGPVKAEKLLAEAQWAVDTFRKATEFSRKNAFALVQYVAQAHAGLSGDRTHQLLADNPLAPLPLIQEHVFEKLAGQTASRDRTHLELAAAGFQKAEKKGMPVLLVLTKAQPKPDEWDSATAGLLATLNSRQTALPMRNCVLVLLPIDELPALTNLVKLPVPELAERTTPTMVLTQGDGTEIAPIASNTSPRAIAKRLWDAVNQSRLNRAEKLIASGTTREASTLLKAVKTSPFAGKLKQQAAIRLAELQGPAVAKSAKISAAPISDSERSAARDSLPHGRLAN